MKKEQQFFAEFDEARKEFTYAHVENKDYHVLQVGLTATFYINEGWRAEKRQVLAEAIERYIAEYGNKLQWGFLGDVNSLETFVFHDRKMRVRRLLDLEDDSAETQWSSGPGIDYVSDYQIELFSPAGWFEHIHRPLSYIRFFLPVAELKDNGCQRFEKLVLDFCQLIQPMHGLAGFGTQQLYDDNPYQYLECEIAQHFNGIDINSRLSNHGLRDGIRSVNWYTILADEWVEKAGGRVYLEQQFAGTEIRVIPYHGGLLIRAGAWPELGWEERDAKPELYVRVNQILKSVRTPSFGSFHLGSNAGEIRMHTVLTEKWQQRFDVELPPVQPVTVPQKPIRITAKSGEICPYSGRWVTIAGGHQQFIDIRQGQEMPEATQYQSNMYAPEIRIPAAWSLLQREDGGSVYVNHEEVD